MRGQKEKNLGKFSKTKKKCIVRIIKINYLVKIDANDEFENESQCSEKTEAELEADGLMLDETKNIVVYEDE